jgi:hypothetical protein
MASSSRKKTTMAKLNREAAVRERRARKKAKKEARKQAAALGEVADTNGMPSDDENVSDEGVSEALPLAPARDNL